MIVMFNVMVLRTKWVPPRLCRLSLLFLTPPVTLVTLMLGVCGPGHRGSSPGGAPRGGGWVERKVLGQSVGCPTVHWNIASLHTSV